MHNPAKPCYLDPSTSSKIMCTRVDRIPACPARSCGYQCTRVDRIPARPKITQELTGSQHIQQDLTAISAQELTGSQQDLVAASALELAGSHTSSKILWLPVHKSWQDPSTSSKILWLLVHKDLSMSSKILYTRVGRASSKILQLPAQEANTSNNLSVDKQLLEAVR
jgi:hypothetical protein